MSIKSLMTDNLKNDQNLQINNLIANSVTFSTLNVTNLNVSNLISTYDINSSNFAFFNSTATDVLTVELNASITILNIGSFINFPSSPYTDLQLSVFFIYSADPIWEIYSNPTATIIGGIQIVKMGRICVCNILPFSITGGSVGAGQITITDSIVLPNEVRPFNLPTIMKNFKIQENAVATPCYIRYGASGDFTFSIRKFADTVFTNGVLNIVLQYQLNFSYISLV